MLAEAPQTLLLSAYLKEGTTVAHEKLDRRIMALDPFSDRKRYAAFLRMQLRLHRVVSRVAALSDLSGLLPSLTAQQREAAVLADCVDMGVEQTAINEDLAVADALVIAEGASGLGWVYTAEGSTLGAAFLLKHAKEGLQLSETFGARHLAAHADGRGLHWRTFKAELDAVELTEAQREQALAGALQAFAFVYQSVESLLT